MNNYDPLRDFLMQEKAQQIVLTFAEIEDIIDAPLPRAAKRASWWDCTRSPEIGMPQRVACIAAGFTATRLPDAERVRFARKR